MRVQRYLIGLITEFSYTLNHKSPGIKIFCHGNAYNSGCTENGLSDSRLISQPAIIVIVLTVYL